MSSPFRVQTKFEENSLPARYFTGIMIFCFVVGTDLENVFKIEGFAEMSISKLRDVIYEKKKKFFENQRYDSCNLNLWVVDIPYDTENVQLRTLQNRSRDMEKEKIIIQELGGKKLSPVDDIGDIFTYNSKHIRIIVQIPTPPPATTVTPKYIPSDEVKIEIKNKVMKTFPHIEISSELIDALALIWDVRVAYNDFPGQQNDPYVELKKEPSFFKVNFPRGITKETSKTVDLCLPSYSKSGMNYHNPFYDDPQFTKIVSLVQTKIDENPGDIIVLSGVSGGGKTSTSFGIAMKNWSIYIDFSPRLGNYPGSQLQSELKEIRGANPQFERIDQQNRAFQLLDIAVISRGLLLIKMLTEGKISTPSEWLFVQLRNMTDSKIREKLGNEIYDKTSLYFSNIIQEINDLLSISNLVLIFDEAQVLCGFTSINYLLLKFY
ncbi:hypothetical protein RhiirA4_520434 [Rhizophagus irregularis]|uniref:Crinkler effector protein N-terminal domain-containing protein n=1 Tax=Rhizophagus irregularis TaxID=588596 RepID=A0A2I1HPV4_9GLOM|nr:hypothetical protein RhiirA4_520434 [Rhizophagus irregularis]